MSRKPAAMVLVVALMGVAGCQGENAQNLVDPPGNAPELAGSWQAPWCDGCTGCMIVDASGDLVAVRGNRFVLAMLGVDELNADGHWRPAEFWGFPISYAAVAEVTLTGHTSRLEFTATVQCFGVTVGTYSVVVEGVYDGNTIAGTMTESSNLPGVPATDEPFVNDIEYSRSDCSESVQIAPSPAREAGWGEGLPIRY